MKKILFIITLILFSYTQAQEPWVYENEYGKGKKILESYDGGILILASINWQHGDSKLFKLDRTGVILWEYTLTDDTESLSASKLEELNNGDILIGGRTHKYEEAWGDAFLMKLDACGNLIWFQEYGWENELDQLHGIIPDEDGSIFILQSISTSEGRFTLRKLNSEGEILWTKQHLQDIGGSPDGIIRTSDGGFILNGTVYVPPYYDPEYPVHMIRNAVVKTDSLGSEEWVSIYRWEEDNIDTVFMSVGGGVQEFDDHSYNVVTHSRNNSKLTPIMYELNVDGDLLWHKEFANPDTAYADLQSVIVNDSIILVALAVAQPIDLYGIKRLQVYKMDIYGNKLDQYVDQVRTGILSDFRLTKDSSSVFIMPSARYQNSTYSLYALKLNPYTMELDSFALEDDTEYDYFCPEGVVDQTINFPNLGVEDVFVKETQQLRIAPNPAKNYTYVYFEIENYNRSAKIEIHNMQGQQICSYPTLASEGRLYQDLSSYSSGMYIVSLVLDNRVVETQQMVVE